MRGFKEFVLSELRAAFTAPVDDVKVSASRYGLHANFTTADGNFFVAMDGPEQLKLYGTGRAMPITTKSYEFGFSGPHKPHVSMAGDNPNARDLFNLAGDSKNPNAVYSNVILVMRKMMQMVDAEGLTFSGYEPEQNLIYDRIYKSFLSKTYTRVAEREYLRNDLYAAIMADQDDPRREAILAAREEVDVFNAQIANLRSERRARRQPTGMRRANEEPTGKGEAEETAYTA
jgi:hypothetical protein